MHLILDNLGHLVFLELLAAKKQFSKCHKVFCLSVIKLKFRFLKVPKDYLRLHKVTQGYTKVTEGYPRLSKVTQCYPKFPKVNQGYPMLPNVTQSIHIEPKNHEIVCPIKKEVHLGHWVISKISTLRRMV